MWLGSSCHEPLRFLVLTDEMILNRPNLPGVILYSTYRGLVVIEAMALMYHVILHSLIDPIKY